MPHDLSPQYDAVTGMGKIEKVFKQPWHFLVFRITPALPALALGVMIFGGIFSGSFLAREQKIFYVFVGTALLAFGLIRAKNVISDMSESAVLYEHGIAHVKANNLTVLPWGQMLAIWAQDQRDKPMRFGPYGVYMNYIIEMSNGQKHTLTNSLYDATSLMEVARKKMIEILSPGCKAAFDAGQTIDFGPISLNKNEGIKVREKQLSWDSITEVQIVKATLSIVRRESLFNHIKVPTAQIPNVDVFLDLIYKIWYVEGKEKE